MIPMLAPCCSTRHRRASPRFCNAKAVRGVDVVCDRGCWWCFRTTVATASRIADMTLLFDPELLPQTLPVGNRHVLKMQSVMYAFLDWLGRRLDTNTWLAMSDPSTSEACPGQRPPRSSSRTYFVRRRRACGAWRITWAECVADHARGSPI